MTAHVPHHAVSTLPSAVEWVVALLWLLAAFVAKHGPRVAAFAGRMVVAAGSVAGVILLGVTP